MKSPFSFIVQPQDNKRYNNTKKIGGIEFVVSTSEEDYESANREAVVLSTPIGYCGEIEPGDTLLVHHNVFKFYNDIKGRRKSGKSFLKENLFLVDNDQFFLYKKIHQWYAHDKYCFVEPIPPKESIILKPLKEEPLVAKMIYPNSKLSQQGVKRGDLVSFKPDSEYKFTLDGKKLYRMYDHQITMVL